MSVARSIDVVAEDGAGRDHDGTSSAGRDTHQAGHGNAPIFRRRRGDCRSRAGQGLPAESAAGCWRSGKPWPSMLRGIFNDPDRYVKQYWIDIPGCYFTGDVCADATPMDTSGSPGRVDDVINVSGHRLGTMEIESALADSRGSCRGGVRWRCSHEMKGQGIAAFVTLANNITPSPEALRRN